MASISPDISISGNFKKEFFMRLTKDDKDQVIKLYNSGYSLSKIANEVVCSRTLVTKVIKEAKINIRPGFSNNEDALFRKIKKSTNGCWEWQGSLNNKGYGQFHIYKKMWLTHRFMYEKFNGLIGKLHVCHKCDNPKCCNPEHLFLGTRKDNMIDMARKNRASSMFHKLSLEQVKEIKRLLGSGEHTQSEIANNYGVWPSTISKIKTEVCWKYYSL